MNTSDPNHGIYTDPAFSMATEQFRVTADYLGIAENMRAGMLYPKRAIAVTLPIHREESQCNSWRSGFTFHVDELEVNKPGLSKVS